AHEAAHILLHRVLFLKESRDIFGGLASRSELCRSVGVPRPGYQGEWWEWQANRGMSALLMPRRALQDWMVARETASPGESVTASVNRALFASRPVVAGYDARDAVTYVWLSQGLLMTVYIWNWVEIALRVRTGDVATDFHRPVDFQGYWLAQDLGRALYHAI